MDRCYVEDEAVYLLYSLSYQLCHALCFIISASIELLFQFWNSVCANRNDYINLCSVLSLACNEATSTKLHILQISLLYVLAKKRAFLRCINWCLRFSTSVNKKLSLSLALNPSLDKMPSTFSAECFPDRTDVQCLHRWQKVLNPELVKGPWSKEVSIQLDFLFCFYFLLTLTKNWPTPTCLG